MTNYTTFELATHHDITIVHITARRVYLNVVEKLREEIQALVSETNGPLLLDMSGVSVVNSAGLGVIIELQDIMEKENRKLVLCCLQPLMQEIFTRMKLETLIKVAENQEDGLQMVAA